MNRVIGFVLLSFAFMGFAQAELIAQETIVGVGMVLSQNQDGKVLVEGLVPNSPAEHSGMIKSGDLVIEVMPLPDTQWVGVEGMPLDTVVQLIRGEEGTAVGLMIQPGTGGSFKEVELTREKITIED